MMVSANNATCVPIEPMVAGPSARKNARTSSSSLSGAKRGRPPWRARSPASRKYCRKPEIRTPQAAAWPGARKKRRQRQRHHHREIEEDRRRRRAGKAMHDVEHAAIERHQRDQQQIGKGDPRQLDREPPLLGVLGEARRENAHGLRHEQPGDDEQDQLREKQQREDAVGEQSRRRLAASRHGHAHRPARTRR